MPIQSGEAGFAWLREALEGKRAPDSFTCSDVPYERLRRAIADRGLSLSDRVVRLRHGLRYASGRSSAHERARTMPCDALVPSLTQDDLVRHGLRRRAGGWIE